MLATPRSHEAPPRQPPLHLADTGRVPSRGDRGGPRSQQGEDAASGPGSPSGRGSGGGGGGSGGGGAKGSPPRGGSGRGYQGQCGGAFEVAANAVDISFGGAACEPFQVHAVEEAVAAEAEAGEGAEAEAQMETSLVSAASFSFSHQGSLGEAEAEAAVEVAALSLLQQAADAHLALLMGDDTSSEAAANTALTAAVAACLVPTAAPAAVAANAVASVRPGYAAALMRGQVAPYNGSAAPHPNTLMGAGTAPMDLPPIATFLRAAYSAGDKPAEGMGMSVGVASLPIAVARGRLASEAGDTTSEDDGEGDGEDDSSDEEEGAADVRGSNHPRGGEESDVLATDDPQVGRGGEEGGVVLKGQVMAGRAERGEAGCEK